MQHKQMNQHWLNNTASNPTPSEHEHVLTPWPEKDKQFPKKEKFPTTQNLASATAI